MEKWVTEKIRGTAKQELQHPYIHQQRKINIEIIATFKTNNKLERQDAKENHINKTDRQ
jgi:hypothetical protein